MKVCIASLMCWVIAGTVLPAQTWQLALQQESTTIPFTRFRELHPGLEVAYVQPVNKRGNWERSWVVQAGYFYHRSLSSAVYVKGGAQFRYQPISVLALDLQPTVGYMHSFFPGNVYELEEGNFVGKTQYGRPTALIDVGVGLSFFPESKWSPFIRTRLGVETPFANGIPVFPHTFYQLGLSYRITAKS
ncbi:MAG: hypothetical protein AAFR61_11865 [Bacteroidota bacterium]